MENSKSKKKILKKIVKITVIVIIMIGLLVGGGILFIMKKTGINRLPDKIEIIDNDEMKRRQEEEQDGENQLIINE